MRPFYIFVVATRPHPHRRLVNHEYKQHSMLVNTSVYKWMYHGIRWPQSYIDNIDQATFLPPRRKSVSGWQSSMAAMSYKMIMKRECCGLCL